MKKIAALAGLAAYLATPVFAQIGSPIKPGPPVPTVPRAATPSPFASAILSTPGAEAYFPLSEATGATTATDSVRGRPGTINNGGTGVVLNYPRLSETDYNGATPTFVSSSTGNISVPNVSLGNLQYAANAPFTVIALLAPNVTRSGASTRYTVLGTIAGAGWALRLQWSSVSSTTYADWIMSSTSGATTLRVTSASSADIPNTTPICLASTYDGSATPAGVKIYYNGVQQSTTTVTNTPLSGSTTSNSAMFIGDVSGSVDYYNGKMGNIAVYNGALSQNIITSICSSANLPRTISDPIYTPVPLIDDNDFDGDVDGLSGLAMEVGLQKASKVNLIAVGDPDPETYAASELRAVLGHYGLTQVPIGASRRSAAGNSSLHAQAVTQAFGTVLNDNINNYANTTSIYRCALAAQADHSVVIKTGGILYDIAQLLKSSPDSCSSLTGVQLVAKKVWTLDVEGGNYSTNAATPNFSNDISDAQYVFTNWPANVELIGMGNENQTANTLVGSSPGATDANSPLHDAFTLWCAGNMGATGCASYVRPAYASMDGMLAILGSGGGANYSYPFTHGQIAVVTGTGATTQTAGPNAFDDNYVSLIANDVSFAQVMQNYVNANGP